MKTIITAGKGGTGKSVLLANLLIHHILPESNGDTLVVDADPHQSLTQLLAAHYHFPPPTALGDLRHKHENALRTGQSLMAGSRSELAELLIQQSLLPLPGGTLLVMGQNDRPGCQCVVNNLLGQALDLVRGRFNLAVVDNEAGIEQIGRHGWPVDVLLLLSTPRALDQNVAGRIMSHAKAVQREVRCSLLVLNRFQVHFEDFRTRTIPPVKTDLIVTLPYSKSLDETDSPDPEWLGSVQVLWNIIKRQ